MIEAEYLIFCRSVRINSDGMDFMGTLDTVLTTGFPTVYTNPLVVVCKIRAKKTLSGDDIPFKIEVERKGNVVFRNEGTYPGRRVPNEGTMYFQIDVQNLRLETAGKYQVILYMNGKRLISRPLYGALVGDKEALGEQEIVQETD